MEKIFLFLLLVFTLLGCSSTKKMSEQTRSSQKQSNVHEKLDSVFHSRIDTTKSSEYEFTYTKIEFYQPTGNGKEYKSKKEAEGPEEELEVDDIEPAFGKSEKPPNGGIKSIEQWTGRKKEENKGESEVNSSVLSDKEENLATNEEVAEKSEETPVPDPKRWKYIFYLALLGIGVFIYIKRTPIFKGIKKLFFKE